MAGNPRCENGYITESDTHIQYNSHQNSKTLFSELEKTILKYIWKRKRPQLASVILNRKNNAEGTKPMISNYTTEPHKLQGLSAKHTQKNEVQANTEQRTWK